MEPKVSIIVPIYNVEDYLSRCLDSLVTQTLKEIEIIAVNDGSTDGSLIILEDYAQKDPRIQVINKPNGGVSSARNEGIRLAKGKYIGFVDPDDWIDKGMYEEMYTAAMQKDLDIVMCTYVREFGSHSKVKQFDLPDQTWYQNDEVQLNIMRRLVGPINEEVANPEYLDAWGTVWSKIYRSKMIKDKEIKFIDLSIVGTNEDSLFNIHAFYYAKSFIFLNQPYYHYWRANTASVTSGYKPSLIEQWSKLYSLMEDFLNEKQVEDDYYKALNNRICLSTLGLGLNTISRGNQASSYRKIQKLNTILHDQRIKKSFQSFEMRRFPIVWRTFYFCAKSRFTLGFYLLLLTIETLRRVIR